MSIFGNCEHREPDVVDVTVAVVSVFRRLIFGNENSTAQGDNCAVRPSSAFLVFSRAFLAVLCLAMGAFAATYALHLSREPEQIAAEDSSNNFTSLWEKELGKGRPVQLDMQGAYASKVTSFVHSAGRFVRDGSVWQEYQNGEAIAGFNQISQNDSWIVIRDDSRQLEILLPVNGGQAKWNNAGTWEELYVVTPIVGSESP